MSTTGEVNLAAIGDIKGHWYGWLLVEIPVDSSLEGELLTVVYCNDGKLMAIQVRVTDGYIRF